MGQWIQPRNHVGFSGIGGPFHRVRRQHTMVPLLRCCRRGPAAYAPARDGVPATCIDPGCRRYAICVATSGTGWSKASSPGPNGNDGSIPARGGGRTGRHVKPLKRSDGTAQPGSQSSRAPSKRARRASISSSCSCIPSTSSSSCSKRPAAGTIAAVVSSVPATASSGSRSPNRWA